MDAGLRHLVLPSPIGPLTLVADSGALAAVYMESHERRPGPERLGPAAGTPAGGGDAGVVGDPAAGDVLAEAAAQFAAYFDGSLTEFSLPLAPRGTDFQLRAWELLRAIPYGSTRSYSDLARELGSVRLTRAVGTANGRNPLSIVVPCHRVIGAGGSLTGYAGGLDRKLFLLRHEGVLPPEDPALF
ncbi:methylated-DNA--[protein]-cysteine S-methyltransferase [Zafaria sp. Z1313]|uniref:methylated-DNA--[protein]-cysteine S-methyltransferase n=1 Tax=unclassified Zafaria TaxID=2828765 RepID=UPI002E76669D|nr:methylated-DNA--[protein]-cysteine S-methyltransferase [Zafaria sp. J156]MEE1621610.1 methylated-DNA--[protein]-cysteine S-methyltransferase [Zafaria sp. J156]